MFKFFILCFLFVSTQAAHCRTSFNASCLQSSKDITCAAKAFKCNTTCSDTCRQIKQKATNASCLEPCDDVDRWGHCYTSWNPFGVNDLHLDLSVIENTSALTYTDVSTYPTLQAYNKKYNKSYNKNSEFKALTGFYFPQQLFDETKPFEKNLTVTNQILTIDCTESDMKEWCESTIFLCDDEGVLGLVSILHTPDFNWGFPFAAVIYNSDDTMNCIIDEIERYSLYVVNKTDAEISEYAQTTPNMFRCCTKSGEECPSSSRRRRLLRNSRRGC